MLAKTYTIWLKPAKIVDKDHASGGVVKTTDSLLWVTVITTGMPEFKAELRVIIPPDPITMHWGNQGSDRVKPLAGYMSPVSIKA